MPTALVLGATGFIGGHIGLALLERGWQVRGLRRDPASSGILEPAPVEPPPTNERQTDDLPFDLNAVIYIFTLNPGRFCFYIKILPQRMHSRRPVLKIHKSSWVRMSQWN